MYHFFETMTNSMKLDIKCSNKDQWKAYTYDHPGHVDDRMNKRATRLDGFLDVYVFVIFYLKMLTFA